MNKKKALFRHEMRNMIWFLLAGILVTCLLVYILNTLVNEALDYVNPVNSIDQFKVTFNSLFVDVIPQIGVAGVFGLTVMTVIQFRDMHSRKSQEYLHSLPFTKRERFAIKAATGYMVITVVMIAATAGILFVRGNHIDIIHKSILLSPYYKVMLGNDTLWHVVSIMIVLWLGFMAVYSIVVLAHTFVNKGVLASIIGFGMTMTPFWFFNVVSIITTETGKHEVWKDWVNLRGYFGVFIGLSNSRGDQMQNFGRVIYYDKFWVLVVICLVTVVICAAVSLFTVGRKDLARGGVLVQKRLARIFLCAGIGLCFGAGIGIFVSLWFWNEVDVLMFAVIGFISALLIYFLCEKLFSKVFG